MRTRRAPQAADRNVLVTLPENTFREARQLLLRWGRVELTGYYNVLVMHVANPDAFLADFASAVAEAPGLLNFVSHVVPLQHNFLFDNSEAFERQARAIALDWLAIWRARAFTSGCIAGDSRGSSPRSQKSVFSTKCCLPPSQTPVRLAGSVSLTRIR